MYKCVVCGITLTSIKYSKVKCHHCKNGKKTCAVNIPVGLRAEYRRNNNKVMRSINRHQLTDTYVRRCLPYRIDDITQSMINVKRDMISFKRKRSVL